MKGTFFLTVVPKFAGAPAIPGPHTAVTGFDVTSITKSAPTNVPRGGVVMKLILDVEPGFFEPVHVNVKLDRGEMMVDAEVEDDLRKLAEELKADGA